MNMDFTGESQTHEVVDESGIAPGLRVYSRFSEILYCILDSHQIDQTLNERGKTDFI